MVDLRWSKSRGKSFIQRFVTPFKYKFVCDTLLDKCPRVRYIPDRKSGGGGCIRARLKATENYLRVFPVCGDDKVDDWIPMNCLPAKRFSLFELTFWRSATAGGLVRVSCLIMYRSTISGESFI